VVRSRLSPGGTLALVQYAGIEEPRSYDIGREHAGRVFDDVQVAVMPKLTEQTADELNTLVRTLSFYARLSPGQRRAHEREYQAVHERLGRPVRASTIAALLTARRRAAEV
jgi:hypothetical protein